MKKLSEFELSLLCLLAIGGFVFNAMIQYKMPFVIIGYGMIFIGGRAFGLLLSKIKNE